MSEGEEMGLQSSGVNYIRGTTTKNTRNDERGVTLAPRGQYEQTVGRG